jgi:hypothetical protein
MSAASMVCPPDDEPSDDALLTEWERDLPASIDAWEGALTPARQDKLEDIERSLEEGREAWQRGWGSRP